MLHSVTDPVPISLWASAATSPLFASGVCPSIRDELPHEGLGGIDCVGTILTDDRRITSPIVGVDNNRRLRTLRRCPVGLLEPIFRFHIMVNLYIAIR